MVVPETRELIMTGYVNLVSGMIELLACGTRGKTHESAFMLYADPIDVQTGLLLLGFRHGGPMPGIGQEPPTGDSVAISVEWEQDGVKHRQDADTFIYDYEKQKEIKNERWLFNGSIIEDGLFMAGAEESLIATYWDPWALINIESDVGGNDERIVIHTEKMPPLHTPVRMILGPDRSR